MTAFPSCDRCGALPEGDDVGLAAAADLGRRDELRALWSGSRPGDVGIEHEQLLECPDCGTLYWVEITPVDQAYWAAVVDPYDIPTEPHVSVVRLAPSRAEDLLREHAPEHLPAWTARLARDLEAYQRALAAVPVPLEDAPLRHAVAVLVDQATEAEIAALLGHADLRVVLLTAQVLVFPRVRDDRLAPLVRARLKAWRPALRAALSAGLRRCLDAPDAALATSALELLGYAREHVDAEGRAAAAGRHASARDRILARLDGDDLADRLDAVSELLTNLDADLHDGSSARFAQAHPEVARRVADALRAGLASRTLRSRALWLLQAETLNDHHLDLLRRALPAVARLLAQPGSRTVAQEILALRFPFYDEPTRQVLRRLSRSRSFDTAAAARTVIEGWIRRLTEARRPEEARVLAADRSGAASAPPAPAPPAPAYRLLAWKEHGAPREEAGHFATFDAALAAARARVDRYFKRELRRGMSAHWFLRHWQCRGPRVAIEPNAGDFYDEDYARALCAERCVPGFAVAFLKCPACRRLPNRFEGLDDDEAVARAKLVTVLYFGAREPASSERQTLRRCRRCGTDYRGYELTDSDGAGGPPTEPSVLYRLTPGEAEGLLTVHDPDEVPGWQAQLATRQRQLARALAGDTATLADGVLRYAVDFLVDRAALACEWARIRALLEHPDRRVVRAAAEDVRDACETVDQPDVIAAGRPVASGRFVAAVREAIARRMDELEEALRRGLARCGGEAPGGGR